MTFNPQRLGTWILILGCGLYSLLVTFNNLTDYNSNFQFVSHVLSMDTIFPGSTTTWRALTQTWVHHTTYIGIICFEGIMTFYLLAGVWELYRSRSADAAQFKRSKKKAYIGLTLGFMLWLIGFMVVGGEWFQMWQSGQWNGLQTAGRNLGFFALTYITLLLTD